MNDEQIYPIENFYDIRTSLRFATTQAFIEAVKKSQSFPFILNEEKDRIIAFYSPLWHDEKSESSTKVSSVPNDFPQNLPQAFAQTFAVDNIYNIYTKGNPSSEGDSPEGEMPVEDSSLKENIVTDDSLAAAKAFFHLINETPAQKEQILTPLINWFQQHEGLSRSDARQNLVVMVNELLIPYFAGQAHFLKSNHNGRICWLNNLLKSAHGQHLLKDSARIGRERREQNLREKRTGQRNNHPLCEHEWTDPETDFRFYDDAEEGSIQIPADAQPRPSAGAVWNVLSREWKDL